MGYPYPGYYAPPKTPGRGYGVLGFFAALGILYLAFYLSPTSYPLEQALLIGVGAIFVGGFISRGGKRGATVGFLLLFLPLLLMGILFFGAAFLGPVADIVPALPSEFENLAVGLGRGMVGALGLALIVAGFVAGIVGALIAGIGGLISGKLFPLTPRTDETPYPEQPWEYPPGQGGGPW
ncbi:MAG: hypothetical protein R3291_02020 [Thermoplasmata archaeon]|nr:hypothetical protein [Thermoplasmata archaeon]